MADEVQNWAKIPIVEEAFKLYEETTRLNKQVSEKFSDAFPRLQEIAKAAFIDPKTGLLSQGAYEILCWECHRGTF